MVTTLLVLSLLAQQDMVSQYPGSQSPDTPQGYSSSPPPPTTRFRGALEASALGLPSGTPGGSMDVFAVALPILAVESGEDFGFELGAALRFRAFDEPPLQHDQDIGHILRGRDWWEPSDFGQILRRLRVGAEGGPIFFRAGRIDMETLGHGHLVNRYDNTLNPDYHPAGATLTLNLGPTHTELFASDILGPRLFAGEVAIDVARLFSTDTSLFDHYHFAVSMAHDFGGAGYVSPPLTALQVDADATLYRNDKVQVSGFAGGGARLLDPGVAPAFGAEAGFAANGELPAGVTLGGRLEGRKQYGGFRPGIFGPDYELSRFAATGFSGGPLASAQLPDGFSGYGELEVGFSADESQPRIVASLAGEYYILTGRVDGDATVSVSFPNKKGVAKVRVTLVNLLMNDPRYQVAGEVRFRLSPAFYLVGSGGTVFFPQPLDSTLVRGFFASLGVGLDFER